MLNEWMALLQRENKQIKRHLTARKYTVRRREFRAGSELWLQPLSGLCGHWLTGQRAWGCLIAPSDRKKIRGTRGSKLCRRRCKCGPGGGATESRQESSANPQDGQGWREQGKENQREALGLAPPPGRAEPQLLRDETHKEWEHTAKGRSTWVLWVLTQPEAPGTWLRAGEP